MGNGSRGGSRPTLRCLEPLGLSLPPIQESLEDIVHPLIAKAHSVAASCSIEPQMQPRIRKIIDGRWFKVKVDDWRGGLILHPAPGPENEADSSVWWLALAGKRVSDSRQKDFYETLPTEANDYLPVTKDWKRLEAERASAEIEKVRLMVRSSVYRAHATQQMQTYEHASGQRHFGVRVEVEGPDEIYVSVGTRMVADPRWFTVLLAALPEIPGDTWLSEPGPSAQIEPEAGEIVYSALMPESLIENLQVEAQTNGWNTASA